MNYYEHHLGDYMRDAGHLSFIEDGAYRRLIDAYYVREKPLPPDVKECQKLARCTNGPERKAVAYVLSAFFELRDDGYHQKRCDEHIEEFHGKQQKARDSANARWGTKRTDSDRNANASANAMRTHSERNATDTKNGMQNACESDAPSPQSPVPSPQDSESESSGAVQPGGIEPRFAASGNGDLGDEDESTRHTAGPNPKPEGAMAVTLRNARVVVKSTDPVLQQWLKDGITTERLLEAVSIARIRKPHEAIPAAYLDKIVRDNPAPTDSNGQQGRKLTRYEQMQEALKNA